MDDKVLNLNAEINHLSSDLMTKIDDSWNEIQQQTVKIIVEATERMTMLASSVPDDDPDHWLHDLRSPGASMMSASALLMDELTGTPNEYYVPLVQQMQDKIVELRAVIDELGTDTQTEISILTPHDGQQNER